MSNRRFWPPRFGLRALMLFVLATAVALAAFDGWRRARHARRARSECERFMVAWELGQIETTDVIWASHNVFQAEQRQWLSSLFQQAIVDSHILRLKRIENGLRGVAERALFSSEEGRDAAWKRVEEVTQLIREVEEGNIRPVGEYPDRQESHPQDKMNQATGNDE